MSLMILTTLFLIIGKSRSLFSLMLGAELLYFSVLAHFLMEEESLSLFLLLWAGVLSSVVGVTLYMKSSKNWSPQKTHSGQIKNKSSLF